MRRVLPRQTSVALVDGVNFGSQRAQACAAVEFELVCVSTKRSVLFPFMVDFPLFAGQLWEQLLYQSAYSFLCFAVGVSLRGLPGFWDFRCVRIPRLVHCSQGERDHNLDVHRRQQQQQQEPQQQPRQLGIAKHKQIRASHTHADSTCYCLCAQEPIIHFCFVIIRAFPATELPCCAWLPPPTSSCQAA